MKINGFNTPDIATLKMLATGIYKYSWQGSYKEDPANVIKQIKSVLKMMRLLSKYEQKELSTDGGCFTYDLRGQRRFHSLSVKIHRMGVEPQIAFQLTDYTGWDKVERLLKFLSVIKDNIEFVSDRCIHKLLKGEFKVKEDDYINQLVSQSFKNRLAREANK